MKRMNMEIIEKRNFIQKHLHQASDKFISEIYRQMISTLKAEEPIIGYDAKGTPIGKTQFIADLKEAEKQIERGDYITLDELEKESETW
jgi:hypothetical protein